MPIGRPSKYKPEHCAALVEHMKNGYSFESFSSTIGVNRDTLYEWEKRHPAFSDAIKEGKDLCLIWWEKAGMAGMLGKIKNFNAAVFIFNMKNRFGWRDRQDIEHTGKDGNPIENKIHVVVEHVTKITTKSKP